MQTKNIPFISVIIPTFNRARLIKRAVNSVLTQTYQNFEIIIVDDGSKDFTVEMVASISDERVKYIQHSKNLGASAARNTGIKAAKGEWIAFLDSDDIWLPDKLEKQVDALMELPNDYGIIHCGIQNFDFKTRQFISERIAKENINMQVKSNLGIIPQTSALLIKRSALMEVGMFNEKLNAMEESELGLKLSENYKFKLVDEFLVHCLRNHTQLMEEPLLFIKAKEVIVEDYRNILSKELTNNYCRIIAGDCILHKDMPKAKKYLNEALKNKFKIKTLLSLFFINLTPGLINTIYKKRYKKKGWIKEREIDDGASK